MHGWHGMACMLGMPCLARRACMACHAWHAICMGYHACTQSLLLGLKRFKKEYLLKILMMCSALKTSTGLGNIFRDMVSACLPNGLKYMIKDLVDSAARQMPSKTTVSRYRMVLDAAFMAWERKRNAALDASGGTTRYLMCDSSMQHGSEFEGIVCLTIPNRDLLPAFDIANKLVSLRPSSVIVANC